MANTYVTTDLVVKEGLDLLENNLAFVRLLNKKYSKNFDGTNAIGNSITIKAPFNPQIRRKSNTFAAQDFVEGTRTLTVDKLPTGVDVKFTAIDRALELDDMSMQVLEPEMANLAAAIESDVMDELIPTCQSYIAVASADFDHNVARLAKAMLSKNLAPKGDKLCLFINPDDEVDVLKGGENLFNKQSSLSKQYADSSMEGYALGFNFFESNLVPQLATGTNAVRTVAVSATMVNGTGTLVLKNLTANSTVKKGELFTITGRKSVNYQTKKSNSTDRQFCVLEDATANASGVISLSVYKTYDSTGKTFQNIDVMPTADDVVVFVGAADSFYDQSFAFHPDFATVAFAKEALPTSIEKAKRSDSKGISMSCVEDYDFDEKEFKTRFDVYFGQCQLWEQWGVRIIKI